MLGGLFRLPSRGVLQLTLDRILSPLFRSEAIALTRLRRNRPLIVVGLRLTFNFLRLLELRLRAMRAGLLCRGLAARRFFGAVCVLLARAGAGALSLGLSERWRRSLATRCARCATAACRPASSPAAAGSTASAAAALHAASPQGRRSRLREGSWPEPMVSAHTNPKSGQRLGPAQPPERAP